MSAAQQEAAEIYSSFLRSPARNATTIASGLRPIDLSVPLDCPLCLASGTDPSVSPQTIPALESPSAAFVDVFYKTKKKQTTILILDHSGSMLGDKMTSAISATVEFIQHLQNEDWLSVLAFSDRPQTLQPTGKLTDVEEDLIGQVKGIFAEGGTALYDSVCQALEQANALRAADEAAGDKRLYAIVVLSDGDDTASIIHTENDMFYVCLPSEQEVTPDSIKVFTIAYGDDANKDVLTSIANHTNGKFYTAAPDTIQRVLDDIIAQ